MPDAKRGEQNQKWSPTKGRKTRIGYLPTAFLGPQKRAEMLRHPCVIGSPQRRGTKSQVAASPLPSRGPKRGRKCYVPTAFSGIPNQGEQNHNWLPDPSLLWGSKDSRNARQPLHSRGSPTPSTGSKIRSASQQRGTKSKVVVSPLPSWGPKRGRKCCVTTAFSSIPNAKHREPC